MIEVLKLHPQSTWAGKARIELGDQEKPIGRRIAFWEFLGRMDQGVRG